MPLYALTLQAPPSQPMPSQQYAEGLPVAGYLPAHQPYVEFYPSGPVICELYPSKFSITAPVFLINTGFPYWSTNISSVDMNHVRIYSQQVIQIRDHFQVHNLQASSQEINQRQAKYLQSPLQQLIYLQAHHSHFVAPLEHSISLQPSLMQVKNQVINWVLVL